MENVVFEHSPDGTRLAVSLVGKKISVLNSKSGLQFFWVNLLKTLRSRPHLSLKFLTLINFLVFTCSSYFSGLFKELNSFRLQQNKIFVFDFKVTIQYSITN